MLVHLQHSTCSLLKDCRTLAMGIFNWGWNQMEPKPVMKGEKFLSWHKPVPGNVVYGLCAFGISGLFSCGVFLTSRISLPCVWNMTIQCFCDLQGFSPCSVCYWSPYQAPLRASILHYLQCYFVHWHFQQCLIHISSLSNCEAIFGDNC